MLIFFFKYCFTFFEHPVDSGHIHFIEYSLKFHINRTKFLLLDLIMPRFNYVNHKFMNLDNFRIERKHLHIKIQLLQACYIIFRFTKFDKTYKNIWNIIHLRNEKTFLIQFNKNLQQQIILTFKKLYIIFFLENNYFEKIFLRLKS